MPVTYLLSMMEWRKRIMAEEALGEAAVAILPHLEKDDRMRWVTSQTRDSQGGQRAMAAQVLKGPSENPPPSFAGLSVIVEKAT